MNKNKKTKQTIYISTNLYNQTQLKLADLIKENQSLDNINLSWLVEKLLHKFLKIPNEKFLINSNDLTNIIKNENENLYKFFNKNNFEMNKSICETKFIVISLIKHFCLQEDEKDFFNELLEEANYKGFKDYSILNEKIKKEKFY